MTATTKRKRRKAASKPRLRPDVALVTDIAHASRFTTYLIDTALAVGAALGLLAALFTGTIALGAVRNRGPLRLALP